jgi:hypothetical protein
MFEIRRSTPSPNPKSSPSPKAAEPRARGKAEGPSQAGPVYGIKPEEAPLAGYLMARAALHRKIDGPVLQNLRAGHETVREVAELYPLGRANVKEDIAEAKGYNIPLRHRLSKLFVDDSFYILKMDSPKTSLDEERFQMYTALTHYTETGVCLSYALSCTALHASKLAGVEDKQAKVARCLLPEAGHTWAEMIPKGMEKDKRTQVEKLRLDRDDVIMDPWGTEKTAILREDGEFSRLDQNGKGGHLKHSQILDHQSGPAYLEKVNQFKAQLEENRDFQNEYRTGYWEMQKPGTLPDREPLYNSTSVFRKDFREQAGSAVHKNGKFLRPTDAHPVSSWAKYASLSKIQAVGVARSLGSNIRGAVAEAPGVTAMAKQMFPRPEPKVAWETAFRLHRNS